MTATPEQDPRAASAQAAGEAASARHLADTQAQHDLSGTATEPAATPDSHAVSWSATDDTAQPSLQPSTPNPVNSYDRSGTADPT